MLPQPLVHLRACAAAPHRPHPNPPAPQAFIAWLTQHGSLLHSSPGFDQLVYELERLGAGPGMDGDAAFWPTICR